MSCRTPAASAEQSGSRRARPRRPAARRDEIGALAVVGVRGEAAVLGRRGDGEGVRGAAGEQRPALAVAGERVAGRGDDERPGAVRLADRGADRGHLRAAADHRVEVEGEVDHVRPVARRPEDARADVFGAADPGGVEHPDGHQVRAVRDAGHVVGNARGPEPGHLLGDRPGDVGTVAVLVERDRVVVDEVDPGHELTRAEVGAGEEARRGLVGEAGVDDRHRGADAAGGTRCDQPLPGRDDPDPAGPPEEAPLVGPPAAGLAGGPLVERLVRRARDPVGGGETHVGVALERGDPVGHRGPGGELGDLRAAALEADDHLARDVGRRGRRRSGRSRARRPAPWRRRRRRAPI